MVNIAENFEQESAEMEYLPHKIFKGVSLKHLVKGSLTEDRISSHLVKVEPFCSLETHTHSGQVEIHEVLHGSGECYVDEILTQYKPGTVSVIPQDTPHKVTAGADGLYILAKFTPALT